MDISHWRARLTGIGSIFIVLALVGGIASGCNNQRNSLDGKSREEQTKAMKGGPIPPEVAAKMAEARAKGVAIGETASKKAQQK